MVFKRVVFLAAVVGLFAGAPNAAIYQSVDEHGNVVFSDAPTAGSEPVKLKPLHTYQAPKPQTAKQPVSEEREPAVGYEQISIVSPGQDETLRDNTGLVAISVALEPALDKAAGHRFQYYLDGEAQDKPTALPQARIENVDRGAHQVEVAVVDAGGAELIRSSSVRFYLHRQSINFPRGPASPSPIRTQPIPPRPPR